MFIIRRQGLGYLQFVRGYEYYVANGNRSLLLKSLFNFKLLPEKVVNLKFWPFRKAYQFNRIPLEIYVNVFFDAGYVYDTTGEYRLYRNTLVDKIMYGTGIGIDFLTYYDKILRLDYAFNGFGQHGLFILWKAANTLIMKRPGISYIGSNIGISHVAIIWLIVNAASAFFTQLYSDEAYYTLFAKHLAFGYFDHPPMIALMIRTGQIVFSNEFGVRFLPVVAVTIALYFIYQLAEVKKPVLFMTVIFSIFGLNVLGFLALPDSPLLFFSVLFFVAYKKFLIKESYINSVLLGITMACMLYSKYHGILVIIFTILSNLKIIKSPKFYISAGAAFLLFIPHILWQFSNGFITISYHLFERSATSYKASFTFEYLLGQVLYYGPVSAIFMFIAAIRYRKTDLFEKALKWNLWGFLCFFLAISLRGRVEVNWTLPIIIPLIIFFLRSGNAKPSFEKWFYISAIPFIFLIALLRLDIVYPFINTGKSRLDDFRGNRELGKEIADKARGLPVITSNYQKAGLVSFYANMSAVSINMNGRRNQFNLWHADNSLRFKKVAYFNNYMDTGDSIRNPFYKDFRLTIIDSLPVMNDIQINTESGRLVVNPNESFEVKAVLLSSKDPDNYRDAGGYSTRLNAGLYRGDTLLYRRVCSLPVDQLFKRNNGEYYFAFKAPDRTGSYNIQISLNTSRLGTWSTKKTIKLTVK